ncbi:Transmembrane amino acid transporter protein [Cryptosporidium felis]|nr:Transmembrane amino acid transporter protein [Cryptosporidium felis]
MGKVRPCLRAVVTLIKSFVGTGIIFLPGTFRVSGILSGNILSLLVCALAIISLRLLVKCCREKESLSELSERVWGRSGLILVDFSIFFSQLGFSTVYMIFVSHSIQGIIYSVSSCQIEVPILKLICLQMVIYLPFIFLRNIENLGFPSVLANISVFSVLGVIVYYGVQNMRSYPLGRPRVLDLGSIYGAGLVLGTSAFNYEGVALILPIRNSTPESIIGLFPDILTFTMVLIGGFSNAFASFVFYSFGEETASPVTDNILNTNVKLISLIVYSVAIVFSVPLQLFPSMGIIEKYLFQKRPHSLGRRAASRLEKVGFEIPSEEASAERGKESTASLESLSSCSTSNTENMQLMSNKLTSSKFVQLTSVSSGKAVYYPVEKTNSEEGRSNIERDGAQGQPKLFQKLQAKKHSRKLGSGGEAANCLADAQKIGGDSEESDGLETRGGEGENCNSRQKFWHPALRALAAYSLVLVCGAMAYSFENELGGFVTIIGGLLCVPLAFVYPPLFYLQLNKERMTRLGRLSISALAVTGSAISFTSVTMAVLNWETNPRTLVCVL